MKKAKRATSAVRFGRFVNKTRKSLGLNMITSNDETQMEMILN